MTSLSGKRFPEKVAWVTQLVVDQSVRERYITTQLLQTFKLHELFNDITAIGLASSHPASVNAHSKYACKLFSLF